MKKHQGQAQDFNNKRVIFRQVNIKNTDKTYKSIYGILVDVRYDEDHKAYLCRGVDVQESFFLSENHKMNGHIYTKEDDPEEFL